MKKLLFICLLAFSFIGFSSFNINAYGTVIENDLIGLRFTSTAEPGITTFGEKTWTIEIETTVEEEEYRPNLFYGQLGIYLPYADFLAGYYPNVIVSLNNRTVYPAISVYDTQFELIDDGYLILIDLNSLKLYNTGDNTYYIVTVDIVFNILNDSEYTIQEINQFYASNFRLYANDITLEDYSGYGASYEITLETDSAFNGTLISSFFRQYTSSDFFGRLKSYYNANTQYWTGYYAGGLAGYHAGQNQGYILGQNDMFNDGSDEYGYNETESYDYARGFAFGRNTTVNAGQINFMEDFGRWIVPAILIIILLGGYFSIRNRKQGD
jgi:hypothetical protein